MRALHTLLVLASLLVFTACGGSDVTLEGELGSGYEAGAESYEVDESLLTTSRFETFVGRDGQHYFHLIAGNGQKVLGSEGYTSAYGARRGIETVLKNGVNAERFYLREASDGASYLVLTGGNGAIIGVTEMYASESNAKRALGTLVRIMESLTKASTPAAEGARFELFKGLDGKHYFHLRANNGQIILQSQGYTSKSGATNGIESVRSNGGDSSRFHVLEASDGKFYFVLKALNGRIIGRGETYASKFNAERGVEGCVASLSDAR